METTTARELRTSPSGVRRHHRRTVLGVATLALLATVGSTPTARIPLVSAVVDAQSVPRVRIGVLSAGDVRGRPTITAFIQRLGEFGYIEGRNLTIDFRCADDKVARLPGEGIAIEQELVDGVVGQAGGGGVGIRVAAGQAEDPLADQVDDIVLDLAGLAPPG
jgi:hypothetical protein